MNVLVESLKRLFENGQISIEKIDKLLQENKITQSEYMYIVK